MANESRGHDNVPRTKVEVDLSLSEERGRVGAEQVAYYEARAPWFDDVYTSSGDYDDSPETNAAWQAEMRRIEHSMTAAGLSGSCVELGVGTGYWTERIVALESVTKISALDASAEMLAIASGRLAIAGAAFECVQVDLWDWEPSQTWDCAAAFFFIEHVPDEILPGLLAKLHASLTPRAPFFIAEAAWDRSEPTVETRSIGGRTFRVVERRRSRAEFTSAFENAGFSVRFGPPNYLIDLVATRR